MAAPSANDAISPFSYYGGKTRHLKAILPRLPRRKCYVEPFAGSAAVLLNRHPAKVETINDYNNEIASFFRVLRDDSESFIRKLENTPYSRNEFEYAVKHRGDESLDEIERARLFFIRTMQSYGGIPDPTPGQWGYNKTRESRGMSKRVSNWLSKVDQLGEVRDRLQRVQVESLPAVDVIERYDSTDCIIYCDPPYVPETRKGNADEYAVEMTREEHREFLEVVRGCDADVAVSGYRCTLYDDLLEDWRQHSWKTTTRAGGGTGEKGSREEVLWTNYDSVDIFADGQRSITSI